MKIKRPLRMTLDGKHPVSLLGELASKRKWGVPNYDVAMEQGPGHAKLFVYKVSNRRSLESVFLLNSTFIFRCESMVWNTSQQLRVIRRRKQRL